jgi:hypothetical protein
MFDESRRLAIMERMKQFIDKAFWKKLCFRVDTINLVVQERYAWFAAKEFPSDWFGEED